MTEQSGIDVLFVAGPPGAGKTTVTEGYESTHPKTDQFGTGELVWGVRSGDIKSIFTESVREAANNKRHLSGELFAGLVRERISRAPDATETVMVTGFPHNWSDWTAFIDSTQGGLNMIGAVVLDVGSETSINRMQRRDISRGEDARSVYSAEARLAYENRYLSLMARHAIRLDCYSASDLRIIPIEGERPPGEVLVSFDAAINVLKEEVK